MKTWIPFPLLLLAGATALLGPAVHCVHAQPFTSESDVELGTTLDADGDGRLDVLVLDRASGLRQLGVQQPDGSLLWTEPESVGLTGITSLSAGRFLGDATDGFVVTARAANRVHLVRSANHAPQLLAPAGLGPALAVALEVTGAGNDPTRDDLVVASIDHGPPVPFQLGGFRWNGTDIAGITGPVDAALRRGNRVRFSPAEPWRLGALRERPGGSEFAVFSCDAAACLELAQLAGLPAGCDYAWGNFGGSVLARFIFFVRGESVLRVAPAISLGGGAHGFGTVATHALGAPMAHLTVLPRSEGALLLVLFSEGSVAATFDFDGSSAPVLRETFPAPAGERFLGAAALGAGDLVLLRGAATSATPRTRGWERWNHQGATHAFARSGALALSTAAPHGSGNVLAFSADPATTPGAALRELLRAPEWSVGSGTAGGILTVETRRFLDAAQGLGAPGTRTFGGGLAAGSHVAVNQTGAGLSLFAFAPPDSTPAERVSFLPAPGTYTLAPGKKLGVRLSASAPGLVRFRRGADEAWQSYDPNTPVELTLSATLEAYLETDRPSPLARAEFTIAAPLPVIAPASVDADLDGMADAWEQQFALHAPEDDADHDGLTNRDEYRAGSDPLDASSAPPATDLATVTLRARSTASGAGAEDAFEVRWPDTVLGAKLESSGNLATWSRISTGIESSGGERVYRHVPAAGEPRRYFRLARLP